MVLGGTDLGGFGLLSLTSLLTSTPLESLQSQCHGLSMTSSPYPDPVPTPAHIHEFQRIVQETTGASLFDQEAWERATELVSLFRMFVGPLPEDDQGAAVQTSSILPS